MSIIRFTRFSDSKPFAVNTKAILHVNAGEWNPERKAKGKPCVWVMYEGQIGVQSVAVKGRLEDILSKIGAI